MVGARKTTTSLKAFFQRLHELGYRGGTRTLVMEYRLCGRKALMRLPDLAAELVRSECGSDRNERYTSDSSCQASHQHDSDRCGNCR